VSRNLANRSLIRPAALGEALNPDRFERLGRYEVHLDRKFERTVAMLLKLKDLRQPTVAGSSASQSDDPLRSERRVEPLTTVVERTGSGILVSVGSRDLV
jgi:hypothetical protein